MSNSIISSLTCTIILFVTGCGYAKNAESLISDCFTQKTGLKVVEIDNENHRLFAISSHIAEKAVAAKISSSTSCFSNSDWNGKWSISLFTDKKFAGYKDEEKIIPFHKDNEWAKSYIGEYDGAKQKYYSFPAIQNSK